MPYNADAVYLALHNHAKPALPTAQAFENVPFTPTTGVPYSEEEFVPGSGQLFGMAKGGTVQDTGLYIIKWFGISGEGTSAMRTDITALLALFPPASTLTATDGTVIRIMGNPIPRASQITNPGPGRALSVITIPWLVYSLNPL